MDFTKTLGELPSAEANKLGYLSTLLPNDILLSQNLDDLNSFCANDIVEAARRELEKTNISLETQNKIKRVLDDVDQW